MTLDTTIPDRDTLALAYIQLRGARDCSARELAAGAFAYADEFIRNCATVPDDVKAIQFRTVNPGDESKPEAEFLGATGSTEESFHVSWGDPDSSKKRVATCRSGNHEVTGCLEYVEAGGKCPWRPSVGGFSSSVGYGNAYEAMAYVEARLYETMTALLAHEAAAPPLTPSFDWAPVTCGDRWCTAALDDLSVKGMIYSVRGGETWHGRAHGLALETEHPTVATEAQTMAWVQALLTAKLIELGMEREAAKIAPKPASGAIT